MSRTVKHKNVWTPKGRRRKMKPFCMTGEKGNSPALVDTNISFEKYDYVSEAKIARAETKIIKKAEKKKIRQQLKRSLEKTVKEINT